jgi:hypothetical protein
MILDRRTIVLGASAGLLSGCISDQGLGQDPPTVSFESLVRQIKHDVGSFIFQHQEDVAVAKGPVCAGQVAFTIQKVAMTVTATLDQSGTVNAGLKIPLNLLTLEPSLSRSRTLSNSITTNLTIWPITASKGAEFDDAALARQRLTAAPPASPEFTGTPICDTLNQLRSDLLKTADAAPCFDFGQAEQKANSVKWAFSVTNKAQAGGKLSLAMVSVGADTSSSRVFANTIEASFIASGEGFG